MIISVINHTDGKITDEQVHLAIRAINRQISEDFEPYWHLGGSLRLEGRSTRQPPRQDAYPPDMRGDAVLYLWGDEDVDNALGYHDRNHAGIPYGFVFTRLADEIGEPWTVTLSHEALELIGDPEVNLLVQGPHPADPNKLVFHWYEMCDAVQDETYTIDDITMSNFILPLYFTSEGEPGSRNDFLGRIHSGQALQSFGINPGGYVGFFNPETGEHETVSIQGDQRAAKRQAAKSRFKLGRRGQRYQRGLTTPLARKAAAAVRGISVLGRSGRRATTTGQSPR